MIENQFEIPRDISPQDVVNLFEAFEKSKSTNSWKKRKYIVIKNNRLALSKHKKGEVPLSTLTKIVDGALNSGIHNFEKYHIQNGFKLFQDDFKPSHQSLMRSVFPNKNTEEQTKNDLEEAKRILETESALKVKNDANWLLSQSSQHGYAKALEHEASKGNDENLLFLLSLKKPISEESWRDVIKAAMSNGKLSTARILFTRHEMNENILGQALVDATQISGHDERHGLVNEILAKGKVITKEYLGKAIVRACEIDTRDEDLVRLLFSDGKEISEGHLGKAVVNAAYSGNMSLVSFLLGKGKISEEDFGRAVANAAFSPINSEKLVRFLLPKDKEISKKFLGQAVYSAANRGNENIVRFLLSEGREISEDDLMIAIRYAAMNQGYENIIQFLLPPGKTITSHHLPEILQVSINKESIFNYLLPEGYTINRDALDIILKDNLTYRSAIKETTLLKLLSHSETPSLSSKTSLVIFASSHGYVRLLEELKRGESVTENVRKSTG